MKHEGFSKHRLSRPDLSAKEIAFAKAWEKCGAVQTMSGTTHILESLIPKATQRDATVVATIVQWLGSNIGTCFLFDVLADNPEIFEYEVERVHERIKKCLRERGKHMREHI